MLLQTIREHWHWLFLNASIAVVARSSQRDRKLQCIRHSPCFWSSELHFWSAHVVNKKYREKVEEKGNVTKPELEMFWVLPKWFVTKPLTCHLATCGFQKKTKNITKQQKKHNNNLGSKKELWPVGNPL